MKKRALVLVLGFMGFTSFAQETRTFNLSTFSVGMGSKQGTMSADCFHIWRWGRARKIEVGVGARFTSYFGSQQFFSSAPASLAADPAKVDSLLVASAQLNSLNLAIHVGYRLTGKINLGFNIDATGFSLGPKQNTDFRMNKSSSSVSSQPTPFNILLVGYNDRGMLNSEFFARYFFNDRWAIKVAYQHLFTEYTTGTKIQQQPEANDRFRNTSDMFSIGVSRVF